eukprot:m.4157 g.4157  ORF g.4157 m.4157 type:complete len:269 (+) comp10314_c0_seq1:8-814(+)
MSRAVAALLLGGGGGALLFYRRRNTVLAAELASGKSDSTVWDYNWDRRDPKQNERKSKSKTTTDGQTQAENPLPTASRHLILIRHGQYNQIPSEDQLRSLTDLGKRQATETGKRLKEFNLAYAKLVVSNMTRARETASIIHHYLPGVSVEECGMLAEGAPCRPEPAVGHWRPESHFFQDGARIEAAFRKFFHRADVNQKEDSFEIIVCHANVIRYFVCRALQLPPEAWLRISIGNCGITRLTIRPSGRVGLRGLGDIGHLPPDMISYN